MDISKKLDGILNSTTAKRYKNFITTIADTEEVWLLRSSRGYATMDADGYINLLVFPDKEFAEWYRDCYFKKDQLECLDVNTFLERCNDLLSQEEVRFLVSPNDSNGYIVAADKIIDDLTEELDRVE